MIRGTAPRKRLPEGILAGDANVLSPSRFSATAPYIRFQNYYGRWEIRRPAQRSNFSAHHPYEVPTLRDHPELRLGQFHKKSRIARGRAAGWQRHSTSNDLAIVLALSHGS